MAAVFAALVSLQNNLILIQNHPHHLFSFEDEQIESLSRLVSFWIKIIKRFDGDDRPVKKAAEAFEKRVLRATQTAEDVIESHVVDQIRAGSTLAGKRTCRFLLDLQKAIDGMDSVTTKAFNAIRKAFDVEEHTFSAAITTPSTPFASGKDRMVGFDGQLHRLLDLLTGVPSSRRVIPIVGMGGIGKTTLAKNALQHPYIVQYFDVCLWATVSQEFSIQKILTDLLSQIKERTSFLSKSKISAGVSSVDELGEELYKCLFGRRYLILLDDMWSVQAWYEMRFFFPDSDNGSRIVVTTRLSDVSTHLDPHHFRMSFLDEDSSWDLFCEKTFANQGCPTELEDIGKKIVENCGGLPLSIVVVSGHLHNSPLTQEYWENVANNMISVFDYTEDDRCLNILSLSYRCLPVHLKPCFLILGGYAEDKEIPVSELTNLWIREGFIEHYENCRLEDTALRYFTDLVGRNLIFAYKRIWVGRYMMVCAVHDVLRELCLKIAKKDEFLSIVDIRRPINRDRRIVLKGKIPTNISDAPGSAVVVRSLTCEGGQLCFDLKLLRVLNKVDTRVVDEANFQPVNLRYLKINVDYKSYLPSSISLLWNLQTLIITGSFGSIIAPYEIWEMLQLRHIEIDLLCLVDPFPIDGLDKENGLVLEKLQTLSKVENFRLSEEVGRRIPNIEELKLSYCDEPSSDYCPHNLGCFQKLHSLECYFDCNARWCEFVVNLAFPNSLVRLQLRGCRLAWEDLTVKIGSMPHLKYLKLDNNSAIGSEWTLVEGSFPCLKHLEITFCDLIYWNADEFHFPALEEVYLGGLSKLHEFPSGIGEIPTLHKIVLAYCSESSIHSAMRMVVEQVELGNEGIQLYAHLEDDEETREGFRQKFEEEGLRSNNVHLNLSKS